MKSILAPAAVLALLLFGCDKTVTAPNTVQIEIAPDIKYTFVTVGAGDPNAPADQCALVTLTSDLQMRVAGHPDQVRTDFGVIFDVDSNTYSYNPVDPTQHMTPQRSGKTGVYVDAKDPYVLQITIPSTYLQDSTFLSGFDLTVEDPRIIAQDRSNTSVFGVGSTFQTPAMGQMLKCNTLYSLTFGADYLDGSTGFSGSKAPVVDSYQFPSREAWVSAVGKLTSVRSLRMLHGLESRAKAREPLSDEETGALAARLGLDKKPVAMWIGSLNRAILSARARGF